METKTHFYVGKKDSIKNIYYFHVENDKNISKLKAEYEREENSDVELRLLKKIPDDFAETVENCSIVVWDDFQNLVESSRELQNMLWYFSSVLCHHRKIFFFMSLNLLVY